MIILAGIFLFSDFNFEIQKGKKDKEAKKVIGKKIRQGWVDNRLLGEIKRQITKRKPKPESQRKGEIQLFIRKYRHYQVFK
jgi:hypothetical protein